MGRIQGQRHGPRDGDRVVRSLHRSALRDGEYDRRNRGLVSERWRAKTPQLKKLRGWRNEKPALEYHSHYVAWCDRARRDFAGMGPKFRHYGRELPVLNNSDGVFHS